MGRSAEISNSCVYDELKDILIMINTGKTTEEIKVHIKNEMKRCSKEM